MATAAGALTAVVVLAMQAGRFVTEPLAEVGVMWPAAAVTLVAGAAVCLVARRRPGLPALLFVAFWLFLAAWMPHALSISPDLRGGRREAGILAWSGLLSCGALLAGHVGGLRWWRYGWAAALALTGGIAVWEMTTTHHLWVDPWPFPPRTAVATYGNPNNFGIVLLTMLVAVLAWRAESRSRGIRVGLALAAAVAALLALATESRSAALGVVLVLGLEVVRRYLVEPAAARAFVRTHRRTLGLTAAALAAGTVATFVVPPLAARNPVLRMIYAAMQPETAKSDSFRIDVSLLGLRYWRESPHLMGTGAGSFETIMWNDPHSGITLKTNMHNAFVELLMQYGIVVYLLFAAVGLAALVWLLRPARTPSGDVAPLGPGSRRTGHVSPATRTAQIEGLGHLVVFLALGLTASSALTRPEWWLILANACACAWAVRHCARHEPHPATLRPSAL